MVIEERLLVFRQKMKAEGIDFYIVPTADFHNSEYTGGYFRVREWLSGFTGSNGDLLIAPDSAALFTDGRYFIQAKRELMGSGITLFRMQEPGVPDLPRYLAVLAKEEKGKDKARIGFDGRTVTAEFVARLEKSLESEEVVYELSWEKDLAEGLWRERPALPVHRVRTLPLSLSGQSCEEKLILVREEMRRLGTSAHLLTKLDDIMWLLNIRGADVPCCPVALCYLFLNLEGGILFIDGGKVPGKVREYLLENGVKLRDYSDIYRFLRDLGPAGREWEHVGGRTLLLDRGSVNYALYRSARMSFKTVQGKNPTLLLKAVKNPTEQQNLREIHIRDGAAFTKFMYDLKEKAGEGLTELSAAKRLESFRREQEGYLGQSFETISAFGENAALMHYAADEESNAVLESGGLFLVDSGGQYEGGTTDITRTIAMGDVPQEQKVHFTAVLKGMLNLASARFLYGCTGRNLDILAREPLWRLSLDYKCGTGHGVGYMLNVHEGPQSIRFRMGGEETVLEEGMVVTDEPGVYVEGSHGIRLENELLCRGGEENENGRFLYFETLTLSPIDLDAVVVSMLNEEEKERLNAYHRKVRETLWDRLEKQEQEWLCRCTRLV